MTDSKLKTLKDIKLFDGGLARVNQAAVKNAIHSEAIKWVKEDIGEFNLNLNCERKGVEILNRKWMKRLNITEADLK